MGNEILEQKIVKIRKPHKCWGCTEEFKPPAEMLSVNGLWDGGISRVYYCGKCEKIIAEMDSQDTKDGFLFGELAQIHAEATDG